MDQEKAKKKWVTKKFHNLIGACGHHLTSSVYMCVCQKKSLWDLSRFVNIRTCFLASYFLLDVFCSAQVCMCVCCDNCFLARKTNLSSDQLLSCSLPPFVLMIYLTITINGWVSEWTIIGRGLALLLLL